MWDSETGGSAETPVDWETRGASWKDRRLAFGGGVLIVQTGRLMVPWLVVSGAWRGSAPLHPKPSLSDGKALLWAVALCTLTRSCRCLTTVWGLVQPPRGSSLGGLLCAPGALVHTEGWLPELVCVIVAAQCWGFGYPSSGGPHLLLVRGLRVPPLQLQFPECLSGLEPT